MATILTASMGRPDHYWFVPLRPHISTIHAARCQCGATWTEPDYDDGDDTGGSEYDTFCQWAVAHETTP